MMLLGIFFKMIIRGYFAKKKTQAKEREMGIRGRKCSSFRIYLLVGTEDMWFS